MNKNKIVTIGPKDHNDLEVIEKNRLKKVTAGERRKKYLLVVLWILSTAIIGVIGWQISRWFVTNTVVFHSPIEVNLFKPIALVNRETYKLEQEVAHQTAEVERLAIEQYSHPTQLPKCNAGVMEKIDPAKFWDIVWASESTNGKATSGKHIACRNKGKWNELGYSPATNFCFNSEAEAKLFIPYYISKNCDGLTMSQCLCRYNTGKVSDTCAYSEGNLSLAN